MPRPSLPTAFSAVFAWGAVLALLLLFTGAPAEARHDGEALFADPLNGDPYEELRKEMVRDVQRALHRKGYHDDRLMEVMARVPRHLFVPAELQAEAYENDSLSFGEGQSIQQPYVVALMTHLLDVDRTSRVLEIGTGSGYHTAILSYLTRQVFSIEIDPETAHRAEDRLRLLDLDNVRVRIGDGYQGWATEAPFDAILVTAAPPRIPQRLLAQLKMGGKMVVPVGTSVQELMVITRTRYGYEKRKLIPVRIPVMSGTEKAAGPVPPSPPGKAGEAEKKRTVPP